MLVDRNILTQRLAAISDHLARIDSVLPPTVDAFLVDRTAQEVVAFNLFLAFQDALDVCAHVIVDRGWELPQTAREHFDIMARHGILIPGLARAMGGCAGSTPGSRPSDAAPGTFGELARCALEALV